MYFVVNVTLPAGAPNQQAGQTSQCPTDKMLFVVPVVYQDNR